MTFVNHLVKDSRLLLLLLLLLLLFINEENLAAFELMQALILSVFAFAFALGFGPGLGLYLRRSLRWFAHLGNPI